MKTKNLFFALILVLITCSFLNAQSKKEKEKAIEFKVSGNCEMCKKTIESSLKGQAGVKSATWNKTSKMMKVIYDPALITEAQVHQKIADSGYETEKTPASDKAYNSLHKCCQYDKSLHTKK